MVFHRYVFQYNNNSKIHKRKKITLSTISVAILMVKNILLKNHNFFPPSNKDFVLFLQNKGNMTLSQNILYL